MKILIVDDEASWRNFHKNNLNYLNIDNLVIDSANTAYDAISKIELSIDEPYDVIFTDLQMESNYLPMLAGEWLIKQIQRFDEYKNTNIVIISATPTIEIIAKIYGVKYISKPLIINSEAEIYKQFLPKK